MPERADGRFWQEVFSPLHSSFFVLQPPSPGNEYPYCRPLFSPHLPGTTRQQHHDTRTSLRKFTKCPRGPVIAVAGMIHQVLFRIAVLRQKIISDECTRIIPPFFVSAGHSVLTAVADAAPPGSAARQAMAVLRVIRTTGAAVLLPEWLG